MLMRCDLCGDRAWPLLEPGKGCPEGARTVVDCGGAMRRAAARAALLLAIREAIAASRRRQR